MERRVWSRGSNPTSPYPLFPPGTTTPPLCPHHLEVLFSSSLVFVFLSFLLSCAAALYLLRSNPKVVTHPPIGYHGFGNSSSGFAVVSPSDANYCETEEICIEITNSKSIRAVIGIETFVNTVDMVDGTNSFSR